MAIPSNPPPVEHLPGYIAGVPPQGYRPLKDQEVSPAASQKAMDIFKQLRSQPYGSQIEFDIDGQQYIGRKEQHYHPPGYKGENIGGQHWGPVGFHPGISLYVSTSPSINSTVSTGRTQLLQRLMDFFNELDKEV